MPERGDPFPHVRRRIRIGFGQAPEQAGDGAPAEARRGSQLADCNLTARGDESLAYDLVVRPGRVSSRVALLLRGAERKPVPVRFVRGVCVARTPSPVLVSHRAYVYALPEGTREVVVVVVTVASGEAPGRGSRVRWERGGSGLQRGWRCGGG